jgi:putative DNA methylase
MRLGCEATAIDINPVAWFLLKCTLEYPQKLAEQTRPLPEFILSNAEFMKAFRKAHALSDGTGLFDQPTGEDTKQKKKSSNPKRSPSASTLPAADLSWHVRAWGQWVLGRARKELARFYLVYADFEPLSTDVKSYERQPMRLVPLNDDGTLDMSSLNGDFSADYLAVKGNPRWVAKPVVAYLWARTVTCKNCRAAIPLLKTRWLSKKDRKRVLLTMEPNRDKTAVVFGIETNIPVKGSNAAQKREHDKRLGKGTMSRAGADCPCCGLKAVMKIEDIRVEAQDPAKKLGSILTAVVVEGLNGKEHRLPTEHERAAASEAESQIIPVFKDLPYGVIDEPTPAGGGAGAGRAFSVQGYGMMQWRDLFTPRQLLALGVFAQATRNASGAMGQNRYSVEWIGSRGNARDRNRPNCKLPKHHLYMGASGW